MIKPYNDQPKISDYTDIQLTEGAWRPSGRTSLV